MEAQFSAQLNRLDARLSRKDLTTAEAQQLLLQNCIDALQIQRVGLWLFTDDDLMRCQMLLDKTAGVQPEALMIDRWSFPDYFAALDQKDVIRAVDAFTDPATKELYQHFLKPMDIRSLLDVPLRQGTQVTGIICCEQTGVIKHWSVEEVQFVSKLANLYSIHFR